MDRIYMEQGAVSGSGAVFVGLAQEGLENDVKRAPGGRCEGV